MGSQFLNGSVAAVEGQSNVTQNPLNNRCHTVCLYIRYPTGSYPKRVLGQNSRALEMHFNYNHVLREILDAMRA